MTTQGSALRMLVLAGLAVGLTACLSDSPAQTSPSQSQNPPTAPDKPAPPPNQPNPPPWPSPDPDDGEDGSDRSNPVKPKPKPEPEPEPVPEPEPEPEPTPPPAPGGIIEDSITASARGLLSPSVVSAFLPSRGAFNFPAPYNTRGARLTNASDCNGGGDCIWGVGYSYWRNINNHVHDDEMMIFVGSSPSRGGQGPLLIRYNKVTEEVSKPEPLFEEGSSFRNHSGGHWYFSATLPNMLYVRDGAKLLRYDVIAKTFETVFDVRDEFGTDKYIWQMHSSNDDRVHSATLRQNGTWAELGCMVYFEDRREFDYFPKKGAHDECQVDKSGRWLLIKENVSGHGSTDMRIIDLETGNERLVLDEDGAVGHSDMGYGVVVGTTNRFQPNEWRVWQFDQPSLPYTIVHQGGQWGAPAPNHGSFLNARPDKPLAEQYTCGSGASGNTLVPRSNEIVCFLVKGGTTDVLVVAPVMTDTGASGGSSAYDRLPKGNLDVTGRYFVWTTNMGGNRLDAFIVKVPGHLLTGGSSIPAPIPEPDPAPIPVPPPGGAVTWTNLVNVTASGNSLTKTGGCGGCPDAGAISEQTITSGDGYLEFRATHEAKLRFVGLSKQTEGTRAANIDFGLRLQNDSVEVRENNVYGTATTFADGDVLRIKVEGSLVRYYKNGTPFYTSDHGPSYPLRAFATLVSDGATVKDVTLQK